MDKELLLISYFYGTMWGVYLGSDNKIYLDDTTRDHFDHTELVCGKLNEDIKIIIHHCYVCMSKLKKLSFYCGLSYLVEYTNLDTDSEVNMTFLKLWTNILQQILDLTLRNHFFILLNLLLCISLD